MKIKKAILFVIVALMLLGIIAPIPATVVSAAPSYNKASDYK